MLKLKPEDAFFIESSYLDFLKYLTQLSVSSDEKLVYLLQIRNYLEECAGMALFSNDFSKKHSIISKSVAELYLTKFST